MAGAFSLGFWEGMGRAHGPALERIRLGGSKKKGQYLFREGEPFAGFFVIDKGQVKVFSGNESGQEATLSLLGPGAMVSAVPLLAGQTRFHADCLALADCSYGFFPKKEFLNLLENNAKLGLAFSALVARQFLNIREKYLGMVLKNAEERFVDFLLKLGCRETPKPLGVSKKNIAALLDITPESLSRIIKKLEEEGLLKIRGKSEYYLPSA